MINQGKPEHFLQTNQEACAHAKDMIVAAGTKFVESKAKGVIPFGIIERAMKALKEDNVQLFANLLRQHADKFCQRGFKVRHAYWTLIDAANFFCDATSTFWSYMTDERRKQALIWATEMAAEI